VFDHFHVPHTVVVLIARKIYDNRIEEV